VADGDGEVSAVIPEGSLRTSRVVDDAGEALSTALDARLTGYAVVEPADALLLAEETRGVVTFEEGVPVLAFERGGDRRGDAAVRGLSTPGPTRVELYDLPPDELARAHEDAADAARVPPGLPAERLARDARLAERTREAAPETRVREETDALAAFLADEERVEAIRAEARADARRRAEEWGLADQLDDSVREPDADV
jgi:hypothetical protein